MKKIIQKGFTLVEVTVVIAIIGILAVLIYTRVTDSIRETSITRAKSDLNNIKKIVNLTKQKWDEPLGVTLERLFIEWNNYPTGDPWTPSKNCYSKDLRELPDADQCITDLKEAWEAIEHVAGTSVNGNPPRDQWNSPYLIDANENEPSPNPNNPSNDTCQNPKDKVFSAGPDGFAGNSDDIYTSLDIDNVVCPN